MAPSQQPPKGGRRKVVLGVLAGALLVSGAIVAGVLSTRAQRKVRVAPQAIAVKPLAVSRVLISGVVGGCLRDAVGLLFTKTTSLWVGVGKGNETE